MNIVAVDTQTIGETESTIFSMIQQSPVVALITLVNNGTNTINYRFQQFNGTTWVDLGLLGTDVNNTLSPAQVKAVSVSSAFPQVRLVGYASGGTALEFAVLRYFTRADGGPLPILSL